MAEITTPKLKVGDQVRLKTGGPLMTVSRLHTSADFSTGKSVFYGIVTCTWFDDSQKPNQITINQDALVPVSS
jgi:uncharacterized protein YodC (DUF2158 family)